MGTKVVHALRAAELPVRVLARRPEKQDQLRSWGCEVVQGDMTDTRASGAPSRDARRSCASSPFCLGRPEEFEAVMIQGTRDLVEASKQAGVTRLVLQSALGHRGGAGGRAVLPCQVGGTSGQVLGARARDLRPSFVFGRDGGILAEQDQDRPLLAGDADPRPAPDPADLGRRRRLPVHGGRLRRGGAQQNVRCRRARPPQLGGAPRTDPQDPREAPARLPDAPGPAQGRSDDRPGPAPFHGARSAVEMLELGDNVADIGPVTEAYGIRPLGIDEQIRRAVA